MQQALPVHNPRHAMSLDDYRTPAPRRRGKGPNAFLVALWVALIAFLVALTIGFVLDAPLEPQSAAPAAEPAPSLLVLATETSSVQIEPASAAGPALLVDRTSCQDIRGTDYRSDVERDWFKTNCLRTSAYAPAGVPLTPTIPGPEVQGERWVLVDISKQQASAMVGDKAVYTAQVTTGKAGWETPKGSFAILYRVANETMTSVSIGAEEDYVLKDVLYTQYFTGEGHALHLNYWRADEYFGHTPSSHGCVGMRLADAEFFWRFAKHGTRVTIQ